MVVSISDRSVVRQDGAWPCFNCGQGRLDPPGICDDCRRRHELARELHITGMVALPDPSRVKSRQERTYIRLFAYLQNYGFMTKWAVPDMPLMAQLLETTRGSAGSSLRILVGKGWVEKRTVGSQTEYRIALPAA